MGKDEKKRKEYFQSIARHFLRLRGAPFFLSSKELDLISKWEKMEIPLSVVLDGMGRAFENQRSRAGRKAKVQSLFFCSFQVLKAFDEHRDRKVGGRKKAKERNEKREQAKSEVRKFLEIIPLEVSYLQGTYSRAQKLLLQRHPDEEELERIEEEIEELLWKNAPEEVRARVKKELLAKYEFKEEEFMRIFKIKLVKVLRNKYRIPYISLYYY